MMGEVFTIAEWAKDNSSDLWVPPSMRDIQLRVMKTFAEVEQALAHVDGDHDGFLETFPKQGCGIRTVNTMPSDVTGKIHQEETDESQTAFALAGFFKKLAFRVEGPFNFGGNNQTSRYDWPDFHLDEGEPNVFTMLGRPVEGGYDTYTADVPTLFYPLSSFLYLARKLLQELPVPDATNDLSNNARDQLSLKLNGKHSTWNSFVKSIKALSAQLLQYSANTHKVEMEAFERFLELLKVIETQVNIYRKDIALWSDSAMVHSSGGQANMTKGQRLIFDPED